MMFWCGGGWAWWQTGLMWLAMIAFWALLIWAVYALVTSIARRPGQAASVDVQRQPGDARRILDERLARGEIDAEEYRRLRRLRKIEGQVRGLQKMIEADTWCPDVVTQAASATRALQEVAVGLLNDTSPIAWPTRQRARPKTATLGSQRSPPPSARSSGSDPA